MAYAALNTRAKATKPKKDGGLRNRKCRICRDGYPPMSDTQEVCSIKCAQQLTEKRKKEKERALKAKWSREAREYRAQNPRRGRAKAGPERQAQDAVNAYVMVRDANKPCIVHGWACPNASAGFHAGHFRGVGDHPNLRYVTWNIHKQCAISNTGSQNRARWGKSTDQLYEANLVLRIGQAKVDWLKGPHRPLQPRLEYLARMKTIFTKRAKHLMKLRGVQT